jgi:hypothetical protein
MPVHRTVGSPLYFGGKQETLVAPDLATSAANPMRAMCSPLRQPRLDFGQSLADDDAEIGPR